MIKLFLILNLFILQAHATMFSPQPIEQQIKESDGVFIGHFLRKKSMRIEEGKIATQMIFKVSQETGLGSDLFGMDEIIVHYPGGTVDGQSTRVEGVPEFVSGEKVVVFIKTFNNRYWGMNLAFGSYKVINYGNQVLLVNNVFPGLPNIGQVHIAHFEKAVKSIKGSSLKTVISPEYPVVFKNQQPTLSEEVSEGQNRSIASASEESENEEGMPVFNVFWLVVALGVSGGLFRLMARKANR